MMEYKFVCVLSEMFPADGAVSRCYVGWDSPCVDRRPASLVRVGLFVSLKRCSLNCDDKTFGLTNATRPFRSTSIFFGGLLKQILVLGVRTLTRRCQAAQNCQKPLPVGASFWDETEGHVCFLFKPNRCVDLSHRAVKVGFWGDFDQGPGRDV